MGEPCGKGPCSYFGRSGYCREDGTTRVCQPLNSCVNDPDCRNPDNQSWLDDEYGNGNQKCPSDTEPVCFDDSTCGCGIPCDPCPTNEASSATPPSPDDDETTIPCASTEDCPDAPSWYYCSFQDGCLPVGTCGKNRDCRHPDNNAFANHEESYYYCNRTVVGVVEWPANAKGWCLDEDGRLPSPPPDAPTNDERSDAPGDGGRATIIAVVVVALVVRRGTGW